MEYLFALSLTNRRGFLGNIEVLSATLFPLLLELDLPRVISFLLVLELSFIEEPHFAKLRPAEVVEGGHQVVKECVKVL